VAVIHAGCAGAPFDVIEHLGYVIAWDARSGHLRGRRAAQVVPSEVQVERIRDRRRRLFRPVT
jgi:hypothetical protein